MDQLVKLPHDISDAQAAAMMMKGLTAWYLLRDTYEVRTGDTILVRAAARLGRAGVLPAHRL